MNLTPFAWKLLGGGVVALLALAAFLYFTHTVKDNGRLERDNQGLQQTLNEVQEVKHAQEKVRTDPDARRAECLRDSRTPENCE